MGRDETSISDNVKYGVDEKQYVVARNDILVVHVFQYKAELPVEIILALGIGKSIEG